MLKLSVKKNNVRINALNLKHLVIWLISMSPGVLNMKMYLSPAHLFLIRKIRPVVGCHPARVLQDREQVEQAFLRVLLGHSRDMEDHQT